MDTQKVSFQTVLRWSDDECRAFLEQKRWPDGPHCPKCGAKEPYTITRKTSTKNAVKSLYKCRACRRQFPGAGLGDEDDHHGVDARLSDSHGDGLGLRNDPGRIAPGLRR